MKYLPMILMLGTLFTIAIVACQQPIGPVIAHKLKVIGNQNAVPMYPDEQTYLHTSRSEILVHVTDDSHDSARLQLDDQTPVQIVNSDDYGAVITVTDGPMKGATGFVAKLNVD